MKSWPEWALDQLGTLILLSKEHQPPEWTKKRHKSQDPLLQRIYQKWKSARTELCQSRTESVTKNSRLKFTSVYGDHTSSLVQSGQSSFEYNTNRF